MGHCGPSYILTSWEKKPLGFEVEAKEGENGVDPSLRSPLHGGLLLRPSSQYCSWATNTITRDVHPITGSAQIRLQSLI